MCQREGELASGLQIPLLIPETSGFLGPQSSTYYTLHPMPAPNTGTKSPFPKQSHSTVGGAQNGLQPCFCHILEQMFVKEYVIAPFSVLVRISKTAGITNNPQISVAEHSRFFLVVSQCTAGQGGGSIPPSHAGSFHLQLRWPLPIGASASCRPIGLV